MKRTPLTRRSPLKRKTRLHQRRATPRRSDRIRDRDYLLAVKGLPCMLHELGECEGLTEADHAGWRPFGRKCSDNEAIPLCSKHHGERTDYSGRFAGMTGGLMRIWCDSAIWRTRERIGWRAA